MGINAGVYFDLSQGLASKMSSTLEENKEQLKDADILIFLTVEGSKAAQTEKEQTLQFLLHSLQAKEIKFAPPGPYTLLSNKPSIGFESGFLQWCRNEGVTPPTCILADGCLVTRNRWNTENWLTPQQFNPNKNYTKETLTANQTCDKGLEEESVIREIAAW